MRFTKRVISLLLLSALIAAGCLNTASDSGGAAGNSTPTVKQETSRLDGDKPDAGQRDPSQADRATPDSATPPNSSAVPEGMVLVPGAKYVFRNGDAREEVQIKPFYIDQRETTWAEFQAFMTATGYQPSAVKNQEEKLFNDVNSKGPKFPVGFVSWDDAKAYGRWKGKRLPTPQEWQLAALGPDGRQWPWGAWDAKTANVKTSSVAEVGSFPKDRSPCGAFDMGGNLLEWTSEGSIGGSHVTDWQSPMILQKNTDDWVANTGFRCAQDAE